MPMPPRVADSPPSGFLSLRNLEERLRALRSRLDAAAFSYLRNEEEDVPPIVEGVRLITEAFVLGERSGCSLIDLFRNNTMFEGFVCVLRMDASPHAVKVQALQSLAIVLTEAKQPASTSYLLSVLNPCFEIPPDLQDEEIAAYFVTLLKSLALRITRDNVQYCLVPDDWASAADISPDSDLWPSLPKRMPLLDCAVQLVSHQDAMVRTAARTAVLSVLRLEHPGVRVIAADISSRLLAPRLARALHAANRAAGMLDTIDARQHRWENSIDDTEDLLDFVEDLFLLDIPTVTRAMEQESFRKTEQYGSFVLQTVQL